MNAPSTSWFLAEGATGSFFTTFVLLANPGTSDATATVTFLPESGVAVTKTKLVPAGQRVTLNIATEDVSLASGAIATAVQSTQPILVERAQYWPFTPDRWYEAHNAFGSTAVGAKWGLAEGRAGGPEGYQTYILLANADASAGRAGSHHVPAHEWHDGDQAFTVNPDEPPQRAGAQRAGTGRRILRRADRSDIRSRHLRRARALFRCAGHRVRRRHERARDPPAVIFFTLLSSIKTYDCKTDNLLCAAVKLPRAACQHRKRSSLNRSERSTNSEPVRRIR